MKILFSSFINGPYEKTEYTCNRFSDDSKSGGVATMQIGRTSIQKHHETLEIQVKQTLLKF